MTTQLNLLGTLPAKGVSPAALASSETAAVIPQTGVLPENGSFFSALMQMLFRQSVDPRTITRALTNEPAAVPAAETESPAPKDRVADIIRALTFLSREKATMSAEQLQAAVEQCDAQLRLKLPGEPGALLSYLTDQTGENNAGAVVKHALEADPETAGLFQSAETDPAVTAGAPLVTDHDAATIVPGDTRKADAGIIPLPPEITVPAEVPMMAVPVVPLPQNTPAPVPTAEPLQRDPNMNQQRPAPAAVPTPSVRPSALPLQGTDRPPQQGAAEPAQLTTEANDRKPERSPERPTVQYPHSRTRSTELHGRTPHSVTVQVPRPAPVQPAAAVPTAEPAVTGNEPPVRTVAVPVIPSLMTESSVEQEPEIRTPQQSVPDTPLRSMMPQRNARAEKTNEPQHSASSRTSFRASMDEASAFLQEMLSDDEVKVVHASAGSETSSSAGEGPKQQPQQTISQTTGAEPLPQRPVQQKEFSAPPVERGAVGAPAPAETKTFTAPAAGVNTTPFDRTTVQSMLDQLSKGVAVAVNENHSEMKIVMHPESLGEVTLRVQVEEGKVNTSMDVQQTQVKQTIEANIPQLREALSAKGLTMDRIEVTTAQHGMTGESARNRQGNDRKKGRQEFEMSEEDGSSVKMYGYNTVEYTI